MKAKGFLISIRVYLRLSRSNVRFPGVPRSNVFQPAIGRGCTRSTLMWTLERGVSRTINHPELADVIGTGFICG